MNGHVPVRPSWRCGACAAPWPCETRRRQFLEEFDRSRVGLGLTMTGWMSAAMEDLPDELAGDMYVRFLGWVRQRAGG